MELNEWMNELKNTWVVKGMKDFILLHVEGEIWIKWEQLSWILLNLTKNAESSSNPPQKLHKMSNTLDFPKANPPEIINNSITSNNHNFQSQY